MTLAASGGVLAPNRVAVPLLAVHSLPRHSRAFLSLGGLAYVWSKHERVYELLDGASQQRSSIALVGSILHATIVPLLLRCQSELRCSLQASCLCS